MSNKVFLAAVLLLTTFFNAIVYAQDDAIKKELATMVSLPTVEIVDGITPIHEEFTNMYLIPAGEKYIAIDAGMNIDLITAGFEKVDVEFDDVIAVFLTHTDFDHTRGLSLFENAQVYISEQEEQMINNTTFRMDTTYNSIPEGYKTLRDGEVVTIGGQQIKGILTPGHTPGAMCYLLNNKQLFVGDALGLRDGKAGLFSEIFNMDTPKQLESLSILKKLKGVEYMFTAHFGYTDDFEKAFEDIQ